MTTAFASLPSLDLQGAPCDLRVVDVQQHYDGFRLGPVSLDIPRDSVVGLIGQNGAGKTTLMKGILGTIHLDGGNIELFGQNTSTLTDVALASLKERVGFVSAVTSYPVNMTVRDVARTYELAFPRFSRAEFERLATSMELLPSAAGKRVHDLSRGMGMKLQLACVLATGAGLLIMDEPTAGLDPIVREEVLDLLRTWMEGGNRSILILRTWMEGGNRSILISSHITSDLSNLADYLAFIDDGQLVLNCGRDDVDAMGVAHLRTAELQAVRAGRVAHDMPALRHDLSYDLLVPDRAAFSRAYPNYVCDPASIDDVMVLLVKGEVR